jgi:hypothetical protein
MSQPNGKEIKKEKNKKDKSCENGNGKSLLKKNDNDFQEEELEFTLNEHEDDEEIITADTDDENLFLEEIKKFEKEHKKSRIVNVYKLINKPKFQKLVDIDNKFLKEQYEKIILLLDEKNIIVHFKNDYPLKEKYRFITEEIFNQDVEDVSCSNLHINFIYEDFHPEMDEDEDDDEY